ncbi:hypothetical protein [Bacillus massiliigorillae]|uniref:hypothetical protein n=1 Tax=Bacillus massiliigorillae TaxID=1243664 RepID=UPI00039C5015|nr:hypothetical protein [Bacillus massiliigorillae]
MKQIVVCTQCGDRWWEGAFEMNPHYKHYAKKTILKGLCEDCNDYMALLVQIRERGI